MRAWISAWVMRGWPQRLATERGAGGGVGEGEDLGGDEVVGEDEVGGVRGGGAARRVRRSGSPGPAPTR